MWLVEKPKMVQVHFTLELESMRDQRNSNGRRIHIASYMASYQLQNCISTSHGMVLDDFQGPSDFRDHGFGLYVKQHFVSPVRQRHILDNLEGLCEYRAFPTSRIYMAFGLTRYRTQFFSIFKWGRMTPIDLQLEFACSWVEMHISLFIKRPHRLVGGQGLGIQMFTSIWMTLGGHDITWCFKKPFWHVRTTMRSTESKPMKYL